jgi:hypothetical protein
MRKRYKAKERDRLIETVRGSGEPVNVVAQRLVSTALRIRAIPALSARMRRRSGPLKHALHEAVFSAQARPGSLPGSRAIDAFL